MNSNLPPVAPSSYSARFFNDLLSRLLRAFGEVVSKDQETPRIVLRSTDVEPVSGEYLLFDLTVDHTGTLNVTATEKARV